LVQSLINKFEKINEQNSNYKKTMNVKTVPEPFNITTTDPTIKQQKQKTLEETLFKELNNKFKAKPVEPLIYEHSLQEIEQQKLARRIEKFNDTNQKHTT